MLLGSSPEATRGNMRILVANDPRSYREVIAAAVQALRPHIEVILVAPGDLQREVTRLAPQLVICSELTPGVEHGPHTWILLYPEGRTEAIISVEGHITTSGDLEFDRLLRLIDDAERLTQTR
jgi:hypothetical protein